MRKLNKIELKVGVALAKKGKLKEFLDFIGITDPDEVEAIERMFKPSKRVLNTGGSKDGYQGS